MGLIKKLIAPVGVSFVVAGIFGLYLIFLGIPKSEARNVYNEGLLAENEGRIETAVELYEQAYSIWPEPYINTKLDSLRD